MNPNKPNTAVVYIVVGTLAFVLCDYAITLTTCALSGVTPQGDLLPYLKDIGLFAGGSLATLLARTGSQPDSAGTNATPVKTEITNTPEHPVPTTDQPTTSNALGAQPNQP